MAAHGRRDLARQRPRVADARRAAVADEVKAERLQRLGQPGLREVLRDDLRPGRQRRLHPRLRRHPARDGVAREQPGREHHRRVGRVRAARDRRDHHVPVVECRPRAVGERHVDRRIRAPRDGRGDLVGLRVVGQVHGRAPRRLVRRRRIGRRKRQRRELDRRLRVVVVVAVGQVVLQRDAKRLLRIGQRDPVLRSLGTGERRNDLRQVQRDRVGVDGLLGALVVPQPLLLRIRLDQRDELRRAAGELQVAQRLGVDREDRAGRAELRAHVADRRAVGERQVREAVAVELDEHADDAALAQHLRDGQHEVGRGRALGQLAVQLEAEHLRDQHRHRLPEHRRLGLDPADAPPEHAEAVDHRRVRVGPDERVGICAWRAGAVALVHEHDTRQVLEVDLVHDPRIGRYDGEVVKGVLAPAQERVALLVALELALGVRAKRVARAERVDLDGVVDDELGRHERVDHRRVAAHRGHRVAHRGKVDDRGHPGEVLHDDARGRERDLLRRHRLGVPGRERLDVGGVDGAIALGAQQVLEQDLQRERQPRDVEGRLQRVEPVDLDRAVADRERAACVEAVR